ncbi:MAG: polysaccharide deacetylase family protein [Mariprofundus sp.]|nr:polysaccharide deacetylase family protein [Mariprofundus sp.]
MKAILTLDYELFFGSRVGTPQTTIVAASNNLLDVLNRYDAKAVFFVDATYLARLKALKEEHPVLQHDYDDVTAHIRSLEADGHQIQLHIHPHWFDSTYEDGGWKLDLDRYRLTDWSKKDADRIISSAVDELNQHVSNPVFAFRAGGWCIQPFSHFSQSLIDHGIHLDSTVFKNGRALSETHAFDFTAAPALTHWMFDSDPCVPSEAGHFKEVAISSMRVSPLFFWRLAYIKIFGDKLLHSSFGDGVPVSNSRNDLLRMLTCYSNSTVSVDGYKSSCLIQAYQAAQKRGDDYFVVIGHPKALTNYSLKNINHWLLILTRENNSLQVF